MSRNGCDYAYTVIANRGGSVTVEERLDHGPPQSVTFAAPMVEFVAQRLMSAAQIAREEQTQ